MHYLDQQGNYYTGERAPGGIEVNSKPSSGHTIKENWRTNIPDVWELKISTLHLSLNAKIDTKTQQLISVGFTFDGKQFSLSDNAQRKLLILQNLITMNALDPQTPMSALDDSVYMLARENAQAFVAAGYARLSGLIQSGTALKGQVLAAESEEEVNAIQDTRE